MSSRGREAAFPRPYSEQQPGDRIEPQYAEAGMTMHEWYAGMALQGLLACSQMHKEIGEACGNDASETIRTISVVAFGYADAMIAESAKPSGTGPVQVEKSLAVSAAIIALRTAANELGGTGYFAQAADVLSKAFGRST